MAKQIVWSESAIKQFNEILEFWEEHNNSDAYSLKLYSRITSAIEKMSHFPEMGKPSNLPFVRIKISEKYLIVYENHELEIRILAIWDSRQNPVKFEKLLMKHKN
ncbi:type II toxin-antitoxin system RelE/ParE family toxin [Lacihabitans sp. CCS-44]|uniref:type II toxin-antitoxin system RelE/ParE family toxin n=1 Tax=Lacihabitans sp. CCS-44 TaxID=2487331 RepID=UPI0020CFC82C|nr:type II toxin-antitoxin system RelE/ParE family toxin [Lacihabitans sp. CCS-44]MCP9754395.1 type II toxin-antitoxin system RelE/ParE family toxin [Lacihabitans sp. CCS-44]